MNIIKEQEDKTMDERAELLNIISDISKDARGFRDRTDYSDFTMQELKDVVDGYYLESLQRQYIEAGGVGPVGRMNIAELEHRLANMRKG